MFFFFFFCSINRKEDALHPGRISISVWCGSTPQRPNAISRLVCLLRRRRGVLAKGCFPCVCVCVLRNSCIFFPLVAFRAIRRRQCQSEAAETRLLFLCVVCWRPGCPRLPTAERGMMGREWRGGQRQGGLIRLNWRVFWCNREKKLLSGIKRAFSAGFLFPEDKIKAGNVFVNDRPDPGEPPLQSMLGDLLQRCNNKHGKRFRFISYF